MREKNQRVQSGGPTIQTVLLSSRDKSSTLSSDSQPSPSRNNSRRSAASTAVSASVTGSWPDLYSASIVPGVKPAKMARADSSADCMRRKVSAWEEPAMNEGDVFFFFAKKIAEVAPP